MPTKNHQVPLINLSSRKAQFSKLNNFSFYDSFDESRTVYMVYFSFYAIIANHRS